ncbi:hypothetical protein TWF696_009432 [Orbilia brochopaga]|uniref:Uncharacterized protein n=1 Tax=Orbilia brochopaga TaxID=3140254 RepID=A0AAV9UDM5_9PEZI
MGHLKYLPLVLLLSSTSLAKIADPRQNHVKKIDLSKRQLMDGLAVGSSCAEITGNKEDKICAITMDMVSCAPVCCMEKGKFVDGCPAGDKCDFSSDGLKCCPANQKSCGPRPTACVDFGRPTAINLDQVMCPSATPSCVTRNDGGAACTGADADISSPPTATSFPSMTDGDKRIMTPKITSSTTCTTIKATSGAGSTSTRRLVTSRDMLDTATMTRRPSTPTSESEIMEESSGASSGSASTRAGTMTISFASPTSISAVPAASSAQAGNGVEIKGSPAFGLLVALGVGMGVFF